MVDARTATQRFMLIGDAIVADGHVVARLVPGAPASTLAAFVRALEDIDVAKKYCRARETVGLPK
jgi:hypothetical protein